MVPIFLLVPCLCSDKRDTKALSIIEHPSYLPLLTRPYEVSEEAVSVNTEHTFLARVMNTLIPVRRTSTSSDESAMATKTGINSTAAVMASRWGIQPITYHILYPMYVLVSFSQS